ncbi:MAG: aldo/keto reductase [Opitutales bacterium]|nr:aldo/keto reductase [Opitutales bacterium]
MKYRRFGRTEIQMPLITCGGMRYQHKWSDIPWSEVPNEGQKNIERIIERAHELGIRHIETARGYGSSEMQLGPVLAQYPREDWLIQTKVAPEVDPKAFLKNFEKSMNYLKVDHVDLLSLHGINNQEVYQHAMRKDGCLEAARQLQKEGRVKHIGFSTHANLQVILNLIHSGEFDYVNLHWYFVNEVNWPAIEAATREDMGVFIISPNDKGGKLYEAPDSLVKTCDPIDPMIFNDLFCWSRPEIHTLSMGVKCPEDFDIHVEALGKLETAEQLMASIERRLRDQIHKTTGIEWKLGWDDGFPEWEDVPNHINTKEIVRLWMFSKGIDMKAFGQMRYNLLGNAGHWFPGEKVQDFDDSQIIKLHSGSSFADRIPEILRDAHSMLHSEKVKRLSQSD